MRLTEPAPESLTIRPAAAEWRALVRRNAHPDATTIRRELGLALDRPIIMTGHQTVFWHPGILAKYLAADAAATSLKAQPARMFVDQDRAESVSLRFPTRTGSSFAAGVLTIRNRGPLPAIGSTESSIPQVQQKLNHMLAVFRAQPDAALSRRIAGALTKLVEPYLSQPAPAQFATDLCRTTLFRSLVARMKADPESCILAYNAAARRHPTAHTRTLIADDIQDRWELPLWHLPPNGPRRHVYAEMLDQIPPDQLAPKALFLTALMRLAACDLMIHGTGGGGGDDAHEGYDLITEDWLEGWLGLSRSQLAPMAVVTATRYLPLTNERPPTATDLAHARWLAHGARHNPDLLHDPGAASAKRDLLRKIHDAPRHSPERHDLFRGLHRLLDAARGAHAAELASLEQQAINLGARFAERDITYDRTWPFPLYPESSLLALRDQIRADFLTG